MLVPDPNRFGGEVEVAKTGGEWETMPLTHGLCRRQLPLHRRRRHGATRSATGRPHRASGALAFHVLEVMEAFQTSSDEGRRVDDREPRRAAGADAGRRAPIGADRLRQE